MVEMRRESVHVGWDRVEMKRGAVEKILEVPEVEDSRIFGQFLVIMFPKKYQSSNKNRNFLFSIFCFLFSICLLIGCK